MSVFRDVEETVTAVPDIHSGLDTGYMVVEHNETEERIAWFLSKVLVQAAILHTTLHSVYSINAPRGL